MAIKDQELIRYISEPERFADLINGGERYVYRMGWSYADVL